MNTEIGYIHHIDHVVRDIEKARELYQKPGLLCPAPAYPALSRNAGKPTRPVVVRAAGTCLRHRRVAASVSLNDGVSCHVVGSRSWVIHSFRLCRCRETTSDGWGKRQVVTSVGTRCHMKTRQDVAVHRFVHKNIAFLLTESLTGCRQTASHCPVQ